MANSSDESLQIQTVYACDRCFFSWGKKIGKTKNHIGYQNRKTASIFYENRKPDATKRKIRKPHWTPKPKNRRLLTQKPKNRSKKYPKPQNRKSQCPPPTGESDLHLILIVFIFLFIRASNSAGKHMAGFCYFTDESGRTKPHSHQSALYETEPVTVIFYAALSQGYFKFRSLFINKNSVQCGNVVCHNKTKDNFLLFEVL